MPDTADVVVIGGGCMGTSIAWQLAKRRVGRVVLLEKLGIALGATGRSSALVRQHYTLEPLARMALHSLRVFERFGELVGGESGFRNTGALVLASEGDVASLEANVAMHRRLGIDSRVLAPADVAEVEPRIVLDGVGAAAWESESGFAEPAGTAAGFAAAAREHGAELRIGVQAASLETSAGSVVRLQTSAGPIDTRTVVVAAGYRSRELLAPVGVDLPITPVRHSIAILERTPDFGRPHPVILDYANGGYYRPEGQELSLSGSSSSDDGVEDHDVEVDRAARDIELERHARRFCERFPGQAGAGLRRTYSGVYDMTPDTQPMLGPIGGFEGLYLAAGFSGHGFKLSPAIGEIMAETVMTGRSSLIDVNFFSPARFGQGRHIVAEHPYTRKTLG